MPQKILESPIEFLHENRRTSFNSVINENENSENYNEARAGSISLRHRRSGLRSNKKKLMNTAQDCMDSRRLRSIPEVMEENGTVRYVGSSEKPPKVHPLLVNDTILEAKESYLGREDDPLGEEMEGPIQGGFQLQGGLSYIKICILRY